MIQRNVFQVVAVLSLFLLSTQSFGALRKWNAHMQEMAKALNDLLPEVSRPTGDNKANVEKSAKKIAELAKSLGVNPGKETLLAPDGDPTLTFVQGLFARESKRGYHAIKEGYVEYGKGILRNTPAYCIACHSRNSSGPDFPTAPLSAEAEALPPFEKAQFLAATRHFDGAIDTLIKLTSDQAFAKANPLDWSRAVKQALTLAVRVKEDPDKALSILEAAAKIDGPQFAIQNSQDWKASLLAWKKEKEKKPTTEAALYRKAKKLMDDAKTKQSFVVDRSADILYLRASALLHEQLRVAPQGKLSTEALLLLGKSYEVLGELQSAPWHEVFYEACVRQRPHSPVARSCYQAYESSIYFGYSGSAGLSIPDDIQVALSELKTLAAVEKKEPTPR